MSPACHGRRKPSLASGAASGRQLEGREHADVIGGPAALLEARRVRADEPADRAREPAVQDEIDPLRHAGARIGERVAAAGEARARARLHASRYPATPFTSSS